MNLVKYTTLGSLKAIIENSSLRFTRGDQFNDPLESNPYLIPMHWDELEAMESDNKIEIIRKLQQIGFERVFKDLYITCFSEIKEINQNKLMWSHYADNYKGISIEFDLSQDSNYKDTILRLVEVKYFKMEEILAKRNSITPGNEELPLFLSTYKEDIWKYESEHRLIMPAMDLTSSYFKTSEDELHGYLKLDLNRIKKINFGLRVNDQDIIDTINMVQKVVPKVVFTSTDLNPFNLKLEEKIIEFQEETVIIR